MSEKQKSPICAVCYKTPREIEEYVEAAAEWNAELPTEGGDQYEPQIDPDEYCRLEEGTYNEENNLFVCTSCYIKIGMPSSHGGWKPDSLM